MPGLAGISLRLNPSGAVDLSTYTGIRLRAAATSGALTLKVATMGVTNYDYHAAVIANGVDARTIEIPFASLRQLWSTPMPWTGTDVVAIALWVSTFGAPSDYAFVVDSIELY